MSATILAAKIVSEWDELSADSPVNRETYIRNLLIAFQVHVASETVADITAKHPIAKWFPSCDSRPPLGLWAGGEYMNTCSRCEKVFIGHKSAGHCADCAYSEITKEKP